MQYGTPTLIDGEIYFATTKEYLTAAEQHTIRVEYIKPRPGHPWFQNDTIENRYRILRQIKNQINQEVDSEIERVFE